MDPETGQSFFRRAKIIFHSSVLNFPWQPDENRENSGLLASFSARISNETRDDTARWRVVVKARHCRRCLKGALGNAEGKEAELCAARLWPRISHGKRG